MAYTVSMREVKKLLNYAIDNNLKLEEKGVTPIAVSLEAGAGIGKTSVVQQVAEERNMQFKKISLHELDEVGDLIGFPVKEYECQILQRYQDDNGEWKVKTMPTPVWVNEKQLGEAPGPNMKYRQTGKNRMAYAKPAWVPDYSENGTIVVLDDYGRATAQLMQACMELILTQKYVSWSLPKKTTIVMTANPDNGDYNVNSLDVAQRTRFLNFPVAFDLDAWALWAEKAKLDGRCINFVMNYANELFNSDEDGNHICNPRSYVMFANMISGVTRRPERTSAAPRRKGQPRKPRRGSPFRSRRLPFPAPPRGAPGRDPPAGAAPRSPSAQSGSKPPGASGIPQTRRCNAVLSFSPRRGSLRTAWFCHL